MIKRVPIAMAGLILGLFGLGNLFLSYGEIYRNIIGSVAVLLYIVYVLKLVIYTKEVFEEIKNPISFSVLATFPMATTLLSTYIIKFSKLGAFYFWILGILSHIILIIFFSLKVAKKKEILSVFPTWFIMYVGLVTSSVTAKLFGMESIGIACFLFGFLAYLILVPIVVYRVFVVKQIKEPAKATCVVFTAPSGLLLTAYMSLFDNKNIVFLYFILSLAIVFYLLALIYLLKLIKVKLYPSVSAITFPTVISAIGFKLSNAYFIKIGQEIAYFSYVVKFMELVAFCCVLIALIYYLKLLLIGEKSKKN